jgi:hypothetical protein
MKAEDRPHYADAVWDIFRERHNPNRLTASNKEGMLIKRWMDNDLPLILVERAIKEMGGTVNTLLGCEVAVQRAYEYWYRALGGRP